MKLIRQDLWVPSHSDNDDSHFLEKQENPEAYLEACNNSEKWLCNAPKHRSSEMRLATLMPLNPSNICCKPCKFLGKNPFISFLLSLVSGIKYRDLHILGKSSLPLSYIHPSPKFSGSLLVLCYFLFFLSIIVLLLLFFVLLTWFGYFETGSVYVGLAVLELTRLTLNSETLLPLPSGCWD